MRIQHNISALNSWGKLGINQNNASKNLEKLSSGYRINRAGDDAAGLAISEKMRGQIRGLDMASKNAQDGISLIQTAEGALDETHSILQRMRELAVQSANGTYQDEDRANTDLEVQALKSELDRIASSTHFNKIQLLDGSLSSDGANGTKGKAAAKVSISDAALSAGAMKIEAATKGVYETNMTGTNPMMAIQDGATNDYTVTYKDTDGKTKTETVTLKFNSTDGNKITDTKGNTLAETSSSKASVEETLKALKSALERSSLGEKFKIETDTNKTGGATIDALKFTAKDAGTSGAAILSIAQQTTGAESKAMGNGEIKGDTVTVDLSKVDLTKLKNGDTLSIGDQDIKIVVSADTTKTFDKNTSTIFINNIGTTDSFAEAIAGVLAGVDVTLDTASLSFDDTGASEIQITQDTTNKSLLKLEIQGGATLGGTENAMKQDVQAIMNQFVYESKDGASVKGGIIGLGNDATVYDAGSTTTATDRYESYDMANIKAWNPSDDTDDIANHVFTVDGKQFMFVKENGDNQAISTESIAKATAIYGNDLNIVTVNYKDATTTNDSDGTGTPINELDVLNMAERIKEKTGTNVRVNGTKLEFLSTPGTSGSAGDGNLVFQIGANGSADQRVSMSIDDMSSKGIGVDGVDITTVDTANKAIDIIDNAINTVSATRANLGAMQNRLEHTINSLNTSSENLTAAESRIRDVDMAKEMMDFTKNNILTQAAQAMLAQANQQPQGVLQLLQ